MRNVLVVTVWNYRDGLIQAYTLPYVRMILKRLSPGSAIFLVTLETDNANLRGENRTRIVHELKADGIEWVPFPYRPFGLVALFGWVSLVLRLLVRIRRNNISVIHSWCTPAGAVGYILSLLSATPLILDSYEPHAESMVENGTWTAGALPFRLLFFLERKQTRRAKEIIATTEGMKQYAQAKYKTVIRNFYVKPACVDLSLFSAEIPKDVQLLDRFGLHGKRVCVYTGKLGGIYLREEVFAFFKSAYDKWGDTFRALVLTNSQRHEIEELCASSRLPGYVVVSTFVEHRMLPGYLRLGDFAISAVKPVPSKRYCTPIKDGEYWAMGLPVVIPAHISDDADIIEKNDVGYVLKKLDNEEYRKALTKIEEILSRPREDTIRQIRTIARRYRTFNIAEEIYGKIYGTKE